MSKIIIRSKTPLRLSFSGGGTDIATYASEFGGLVLNATIDMYAYCTLEDRIDTKVGFFSLDYNQNKIFSSRTEMSESQEFLLQIGIYQYVIDHFCNGVCIPINIYTYSDAPAGSGLGSSSTMVVGILKAFVEYLNLPLGNYDIAKMAYKIEREVLNLAGGKQDQYAATFGGFNYIDFKMNGEVIVNPLRIKNWIKNELESSIVIFNTGILRESAKVIEEQSYNIQHESNSIEAMHQLKNDTILSKEALLLGEIKEFAKILGKSWETKKRVAKSITNSHIDQIYEQAISAGAYGGKVSGAGGGGFMMFISNPTQVPQVMKALSLFEGEIIRPHFTEKGMSSWKLYEQVR